MFTNPLQFEIEYECLQTLQDGAYSTFLVFFKQNARLDGLAPTTLPLESYRATRENAHVLIALLGLIGVLVIFSSIRICASVLSCQEPRITRSLAAARRPGVAAHICWFCRVRRARPNAGQRARWSCQRRLLPLCIPGAPRIPSSWAVLRVCRRSPCSANYSLVLIIRLQAPSPVQFVFAARWACGCCKPSRAPAELRQSYRDLAQADPPNWGKIPQEDLLGVTIILLTCSYRKQARTPGTDPRHGPPAASPESVVVRETLAAGLA